MGSRVGADLQNRVYLFTTLIHCFTFLHVRSKVLIDVNGEARVFYPYKLLDHVSFMQGSPAGR